MKHLLLILLTIISVSVFAQTESETLKRKFSFGVDIFTDFWQDLPDNLEPKTLNPGVNVYGTYNYKFGEGNFSFAPGIGIGVHNMFNSSLTQLINDSTAFVPINEIGESTISYRKSKFSSVYFDIPLEIRFKSNNDIRFAVGFKFGFLVKAYTKYKGNDYLDSNSKLVIYKNSRIPNAEKNRYGLTARLGYKWLNLWGYYQLSTVFVKGKGPDMYPISVGISILPF